MNFRLPHAYRLIYTPLHGIKNELNKLIFCSLKKAHQCLHAVEWRTCIDSSDSVTLLEQTSLCVTYCVTSLICRTHK